MKKLLVVLFLAVFVIGLTACRDTNTKKDIITNFENSIFLGDSITEGFVMLEVLPRENVIAGAGTTAGFIYDDIDILIEKTPDNIFIMLGSIDILMPVDDPKELFKTDLTKLVNRIRELTPDSKIYFQSITPVTAVAIEEESRYTQIAEYNQLLQELADKLGIKYVDIGKLAQANPQLYAEDGIHFKKEFYNLWLKELAELI